MNRNHVHIDLYTVTADSEVYPALTWSEATEVIRRMHDRGIYNWILRHYNEEEDG